LVRYEKDYTVENAEERDVPEIDIDNILSVDKDIDALNTNMDNYVNNNIVYNFNENNHLKSFENKLKRM